MIVKVWMTAEDTDYGTVSQVFETEEAAVNYLWRQAEGEKTLEELREEYNDDVFECLHHETDSFDTFNLDCDVLNIPLSRIIADTAKHHLANARNAWCRSVRSLRNRQA